MKFRGAAKYALKQSMHMSDRSFQKIWRRYAIYKGKDTKRTRSQHIKVLRGVVKALDGSIK